MASSRSSVVLQPRDFELLRGLFESRVMTRKHISTLYFDGKAEAAKKRVQKLLSGRFITERQQLSTATSALLLAKRGYDALHQNGHLAAFKDIADISLKKRTQISDLTIRHELAVMDVKAAFYETIRATDRFEIAEFTTWPRLCQFYAKRPVSDEAYASRRRMLIKPDGFIRIHEREPDGGTSEHTFFLEVDRGTETLSTVAAKAVGYLDHYRSGGYAKHCGANYDEYKQYPFRVAMVFNTHQRRVNVANALLHMTPSIKSLTLLAVSDDVSTNPFQRIWTRPLDHKTTSYTLISP